MVNKDDAGAWEASLSRAIADGGGSVSSQAHDGCTHVITNETEIKKKDQKNTKISKALSIQGVKVVSPSWIEDSLHNGAREDEKSYLLLPADPDPASISSQDAIITTAIHNTAAKATRSSSRSTAAAATTTTAAAKTTQKKRALDADADADADKDADDEPPPDIESRLSKKLKQDSQKDKDGQKASSSTLNLSPDDHWTNRSSYRIFVEDNGLIWDAALNQTNARNNNNKFYIIQILQSFKNPRDLVLWCRWGRVGESGQHSVSSFNDKAQATRAFIQKFRSKTGLDWMDRNAPPKAGKYTFIERNYEDSDDEEDDDAARANETKDDKKSGNDVSKSNQPPAESKLPVEVQEFIRLIFNQDHFQSTMAMMSYNSNKLPLGKLSKRTLKNGFLLLKSIAEVLAGDATAQASIETMSNQYFSVIPHSFGRLRPPVLSTTQLIQKEVELLDTLTDMEIATEIIQVAAKIDDMANVLDRQFAGLHLKEMTPLEHTSNEFMQLSDYLVGSRGATHHIGSKLKHAFRLEREGERERFQNSPYATLKNSNRRLLWHGSRTSNYGGILSQGLRIAPPEAPATGYMFDKGVYFADVSTKSAGYCWAHSSANIGILLLCEVELGDPMYQPDGNDCQAATNAKKEGRIATLGRGKTVPKGWKDAGCVNESLKGVLMPDVTQGFESADSTFLIYNEYIVYDVAQIQQRYVLYVDMGC